MAGTKNFDPLAYIENAFLDRPAKVAPEKQPRKARGTNPKFRKTRLSAPRPRRSKSDAPSEVLDKSLKDLLDQLPQNIEFLGKFFNDSVTSHYYQGDFTESREDLIRRLLDPEITLEETSRLLGVCPATVRRYTNRNWLAHHRTKGGQRRFRLSDVVTFVNEHGRLPQE